MRTTLSIDTDVAAVLQRIRRERKLSLKTLVNEALRQGLKHMTAPPVPHATYQTPSVSLGRCLLNNLDDVSEALAAAEGESFR
jgi:hypothetical protein